MARRVEGQRAEFNRHTLKLNNLAIAIEDLGLDRLASLELGLLIKHLCDDYNIISVTGH